MTNALLSSVVLLLIFGVLVYLEVRQRPTENPPAKEEDEPPMFIG